MISYLLPTSSNFFVSLTSLFKNKNKNIIFICKISSHVCMQKIKYAKRVVVEISSIKCRFSNSQQLSKTGHVIVLSTSSKNSILSQYLILCALIDIFKLPTYIHQSQTSSCGIIIFALPTSSLQHWHCIGSLKHSTTFRCLTCDTCLLWTTSFVQTPPQL